MRGLEKSQSGIFNAAATENLVFGLGLPGAASLIASIPETVPDEEKIPAPQTVEIVRKEVNCKEFWTFIRAI